MAGVSQVAAVASSMDSNKPINEHKSNTAIMATAVGSGLAIGAGTELFFNGGHKVLSKNKDWLAKKWPGEISPEEKVKRVENLIESARVAAHGTNEEFVSNTMRSIDDWTGKVNKGNTLLKGKPREYTEKALSSKLAANSFAVGMSTKPGRIFNYGIGTAMSVVAGGFAVHNNNKNTQQQQGRY